MDQFLGKLAARAAQLVFVVRSNAVAPQFLRHSQVITLCALSAFALPALGEQLDFFQLVFSWHFGLRLVCCHQILTFAELNHSSFQELKSNSADFPDFWNDLGEGSDELAGIGSVQHSPISGLDLG